MANTRLCQNFRRQPTALQYNGAAELFRHNAGALGIGFNNAQRITSGLRVEIFGNLIADIAAANHDDTARFAFFMAENFQRSFGVAAGGDQKGLIANLNRIVEIRHINFLITAQPDHNGLQVRKQARQLVERRINNRAVLANGDANHFRRPTGKAGAVKSTGQCQAAHHG